MGRDARARIALVVEDEVLVRCGIVSLLEDDDWAVLETAAAEDAIDLLPLHNIDVVFTDIQLAGLLSGWDVAEAAREARADVHVIYTSGNVTDHSRRVARSLFFAKPYDADHVMSACHDFLGYSPNKRQ
jgi:CheY-like chemotaxis protein